MQDAFISYAREEQAFVRRLPAALLAAGRQAWVDWQDIPATAKFVQEIRRAIESAAVFVFVISPHAARSTTCRMEIGHAAEHRKRIVPIVRRECDRDDLPLAVGELNWIFFRDSDDFATSVEILVAALDADLEWLRAHSRLLVRAVEWDQACSGSPDPDDAAERDSRLADTRHDLLLRGRDLEDAERWLAEIDEDVVPRPTALQRRFVAASRIEVDRRYRAVDARRLAAESRIAMAEHPLRAVLLAAEAQQTLRPSDSPIGVADQALRDGLETVSGYGLAGHRASITAIDLSPDGRWLAAAGQDGAIGIWLTEPPNPPRLGAHFLGHETGITAVAISLDGRLLATGDWSGQVKVWALAETASASPVAELNAGTKAVCNLAWASPESLLSATTDCQVRLWSVRSGRLAVELLSGQDGRRIGAMAMSPDGRWLVVGHSDATARVWDLRSTAPTPPARTLQGHTGQVSSVAVSGRWILTGSGGIPLLQTVDTTACLWDLSAQVIADSARVLAGHRKAIRSVAISPDERWAATASEDSTVRLWDLSAEDPTAGPIVLRRHSRPVTQAAFTSDGLKLASAGADRSVVLWDLTDEDPAAAPTELRGPEGAIKALSVSAASHWLATGSTDRMVRLWDLRRPEPSGALFVRRGHRLATNWLGFSSNGSSMFSCSGDGVIRKWRWSATRGPQAASETRSEGDSGITSCRIDPQDRWIVSAQRDGTIGIGYLSEDGAVVRTVGLGRSDYATDEVTDLALSRHWLAHCGRDGRVGVWPLHAAGVGGAPRLMRMHEEAVWSIAISPNERWLATGGVDPALRLYDLQATSPEAALRVLRGHRDGITKVLFTADDNWLISASRDSTVRLWPLTEGPRSIAAPMTLVGHGQPIVTAAIASEGRWLAAAGTSRTVTLWRLSAAGAGREPVRLRGHSGLVGPLEVSNDGRWLATAGGRDHEDPVSMHVDTTIRLWDLRSGDPARSAVVLGGHSRPVDCLAFSPDSRFLCTASMDGTIRVWSVSTRRMLARAGDAVGRNLSLDEWEQYFPGETYRRTFPDLPSDGPASDRLPGEV